MIVLKTHTLHKILTGRKNQQAEHRREPAQEVTQHNIREQKEFYLVKK